MEISTKTVQFETIITLNGRLDTGTSPALEAEIKKINSSLKKLTLDFSKLEYLSSSGLRVILGAQKLMNKQGDMIITNVNDLIMEIFDTTGFSNILTIE